MKAPVRAAAALAIVAVIGFVAARLIRGESGASGPALSARAATASFRVRYPAAWRRLPAPRAGLLPSLRAALVFAPGGPGQELVIGTDPAADGSPAPTPAARRSAFPGGLSGQIVSLGHHSFARYLNLVPGPGVSETVYILDTTTQTIGAVCATRSRDASFTAACERVLATLRLTAGSVVPPRVDAAYARALNAIVTKLNGARTALGPRLGTGSLRSRAQAAQHLATAHAQAVTAVRRLSPAGSALSAANRELVFALGKTADAYRGLAGSITGRRAAAYRSAEADIGASAGALALAYARLRGLGYRIG